MNVSSMCIDRKYEVLELFATATAQNATPATSAAAVVFGLIKIGLRQNNTAIADVVF
jgi:hypothetical protein